VTTVAKNKTYDGVISVDEDTFFNVVSVDGYSIKSFVNFRALLSSIVVDDSHAPLERVTVTLTRGEGARASVDKNFAVAMDLSPKQTSFLNYGLVSTSALPDEMNIGEFLDLRKQTVVNTPSITLRGIEVLYHNHISMWDYVPHKVQKLVTKAVENPGTVRYTKTGADYHSVARATARQVGTRMPASGASNRAAGKSNPALDSPVSRDNLARSSAQQEAILEQLSYGAPVRNNGSSSRNSSTPNNKNSKSNSSDVRTSTSTPRSAVENANGMLRDGARGAGIPPAEAVKNQLDRLKDSSGRPSSSNMPPPSILSQTGGDATAGGKGSNSQRVDLIQDLTRSPETTQGLTTAAAANFPNTITQVVGGSVITTSIDDLPPAPAATSPLKTPGGKDMGGLEPELQLTSGEEWENDIMMTAGYIAGLANPVVEVPVYEWVWTNTPLTDLTIRLPVDFMDSEFTDVMATIRLYQLDNPVPLAVYKKKVDLKYHVEACLSLSEQPSIRAYNLTEFENFKFQIEYPDNSEREKCTGAAVYVRGYDSKSTPTPYKKLGNFSVGNMLTINGLDKLNLLKVVPLDKLGRESNTYTNLYFGPGHPSVTPLILTPSYKEGEKDSVETVTIEILNPPQNSKLTLYVRDLTGNPNVSNFVALESANIGKETSYSFYHPVSHDRYFEYVAVAEAKTYGKSNEKQVSNYVMMRHPAVNTTNLVAGGLNVSVDKKSFYINVLNDSAADVGFTISTSMTKDQKTFVADSIKSQLPDFYKRFIDPNNNNASPIESETLLDSLVLHEVIRTNMRTGERISFPLINSEKFEDSESVRSANNIPPFNPQDKYRYEIVSYVKNPIEMLEKYIVRGTNDSGREYFYLPYKWLQPTIVSTGRLYGDDEKGYPIIDKYETLSLVGLQDTYTYEGAESIAELTSVTAKRVDLTTVRIDWTYSAQAAYGNKGSLYDGFMVMKVCNGILSILGKTSTTTYYHRLKESEAGKIYYTIVPILQNQMNDAPMSSSPIDVDLNDLIPVSYMSWDEYQQNW
jgi:hypothetical protein